MTKLESSYVEGIKLHEKQWKRLFNQSHYFAICADADKVAGLTCWECHDHGYHV
jgi:hypothetical protein